MENTNKPCAVVLAAGAGTRMKSKLPKVLHEVCSVPMVCHVLMSLAEAGIADIAVIVGYGKEQVISTINQFGFDEGIVFYEQPQLNGTGGAVASAREFFANRQGDVFVLCADAPLVDSGILAGLAGEKSLSGADMCVLSADFEEPGSYGRIIRDENGSVLSIMEAAHLSADESSSLKEVNSGAYIFDAQKLDSIIGLLGENKKPGEIYLTDAVELFNKSGYRVCAHKAKDANSVVAANDRIELARCEGLMAARTNAKLMAEGVGMPSPSQVMVSRQALVGMDTILYPNTRIEGKTTIGQNNVIMGGRISNSTIGDNNYIEASVIEDSAISSDCQIGPYAHLRPGADLADHVKIGNFVEVKNSKIGMGTKASHLTYIGDSIVGQNVNFGCGSITANYDGLKKNTTVIDDEAFIGCNVNLIAPVKIGKGALIGAGSTITKDVPDWALALERSQTYVKEGYNKGRKA
ncbi:MAG: bifunctional UDP-N-acetylglucosamine diphosphorylase/glucosamine-1-phosphate N-acetyltransferase GlmU [Eubacteriaceae bacterium]|nr:bifunctional UDP-N-acetylglucosamine diphosphorylase/glucosamine-1-phosphate N-acetyltransferase GlmU [Eubacteriaceae bacterium]